MTEQSEQKYKQWGKLKEILRGIRKTVLQSLQSEAAGVIGKDVHTDKDLCEKLKKEEEKGSQPSQEEKVPLPQEKQGQYPLFHVITQPIELLSLSSYLLQMAHTKNGRFRSIDLRVSLPQEGFIPETYRGRNVRIVGALVHGKDYMHQCSGLNPEMVYYTPLHTKVLGGENITPENGGRAFCDFLKKSLND